MHWLKLASELYRVLVMASPASVAGGGEDSNGCSSLIDPLLVSRTSSIGGAERKAAGGGGGGAKGKHWAAADKGERRAAKECGGEDGRRPLLFRSYRVKGSLLHPYRYVHPIECTIEKSATLQ
mgnify:CR=1 FL=1